MNFTDFALHPSLIQAIQHMGYEEPTEIQKLAIPLVIEGKDIVAQSSTGSGKTAAFGLPILQKIQHGNGVQVLVLTPTRELCVQVATALQDFGKHLNVKTIAVYGGVGIDAQIRAIQSADIVVGTPGRILDHLDRDTIRFDDVKFLVLDEADKMFEMGFIEDVEDIIQTIPEDRQTLLFSATIAPKVHALVKNYMKSPASVKANTYVDPTALKQTFYDVPSSEKFSLLVHLLKNKTKGLSIVFCATRQQTDIVAKNLHDHGVEALAIHGGLTQNKRNRALDSLKNENIDVLVATDVAARGLDIKNITHVYNYSVPKTPEEYIHRIGRTARAGSSGDAVTLLSRNDYENFDRVLSNFSIKITPMPLPDFPRVPFRFNENRQQRRFPSRRMPAHRGRGRF